LRLEEANRRKVSEIFPYPVRRYTVSGLRVEGICFECECRVLELHGEDVTLAWCDCVFPEDHHEMEIL
jgi:hypothetical protein